MRVLVIEDESLMAEALATGLKRAGFAVDCAADGEEALFKTETNHYDLVVLDRDLPKIHGDEVCKRLREKEYPARVLMLTAASTVQSRVEGLVLGADDYLPKPFAFEELTARLRALSRRPPVLPPTVTVGDLRVDLGRRLVSRSGRSIALTAREFAVLEALVVADGGLVTHEELLERAWDENVDAFTNTVRVILMRLRRKLGEPPLIQTEVGGGYRLPR
jgi:DNA-binding response OmpR family regulator